MSDSANMANVSYSSGKAFKTRVGLIFIYCDVTQSVTLVNWRNEHLSALVEDKIAVDSEKKCDYDHVVW